ncbi:hypothetical protein FB45DRAFT_950824, partial [Roridomyces roridus]
LCRGLPLISPIRFILAYLPEIWDDDAELDILVGAIVGCIPEWKDLGVFEMPHDSLGGEANFNELVAEPLKDAKNLRSLILSAYEQDLFFRGIIPEYLSTIASNPSLQEIRPKAPPRKRLSLGFVRVVQSNARLAELFDLRHVGILSKPFVYPPQLFADPKLEDTIWDRVLFHLFHIVNSPGQSLSDSDNDDADNDEPPEARSYLLVCKRFARLGTSYLYENPHLASVQSFQAFAQRLVDQPSLGLHVRRLGLDLYEDDADMVTIEKILARVPGLIEFNSDRRRWSPRILRELARHCGASIQILRVPIVESMEETIDPAIFAQFPQMQSLTWQSHIAFNTAGGTNMTEVFSQLKDLSIAAACGSFHEVISEMRLPSLRTAHFYDYLVRTRNDPFLETRRKAGGTDSYTRSPFFSHALPLRVGQGPHHRLCMGRGNLLEYPRSV